MIHEILPVGMLQCNCSIFGDEQSREAVVIDPGDNIDEILAALARHSLKVTAIVITHAHIDHIGGAAKLKAATGAPVHMNQNDQELYDHLDVQAGWLGMETPQRTTIDVLNAQQDLTAARSRLILAQRDRVIASYTLLSAVGRLDVYTLELNTPDYLPEVHYHQVRDAWHGVRTPSGQ